MRKKENLYFILKKHYNEVVFFLNKIICSFNLWRRKRDSNPRGCYTLSVFKTDPFSQAWVFLHNGGSGRN